MKSLVVIGGGGHAKVVISVLKKSGGFRILGYTDRLDRGEILGVPFLGDDAVLDRLSGEEPRCAAAIGVGSVESSEPRVRIVERLRALGFELPPVLSTDAIVNEDVELGDGTWIGDGAIINSGTRMGSGCIVNTGAIVEHDCLLGDFVHVAPGAVVSGGVRIGDRSFIGVGASVVHGVAIANDCLIGAGSTVVGDLGEAGTYVGTPARPATPSGPSRKAK